MEEDAEDTIIFTFDGLVEPSDQETFIGNAIDSDYFNNNIVNFEADQYLASHSDLIDAFSNLGYDEAVNAANQHYIEFGVGEGRVVDTFEADQYLASHGDLIDAFGDLPYDEALNAANQHYIDFGIGEVEA